MPRLQCRHYYHPPLNRDRISGSPSIVLLVRQTTNSDRPLYCCLVVVADMGKGNVSMVSGGGCGVLRLGGRTFCSRAGYGRGSGAELVLLGGSSSPSDNTIFWRARKRKLKGLHHQRSMRHRRRHRGCSREARGRWLSLAVVGVRSLGS